MKLHLPTKLLAALVASFTSITSVTVGTTGLIGMSAVVISVSSMAQAADDVTLNGTKVTLPSQTDAANGAAYGTATVTASTTLEYSGRGTITLESLVGDAADTEVLVSRIAADSGNVSTLILTGAGTYNGTVTVQSNTNVLANNMVMILQDAEALKNASVKLGGGSAAGRSVLQIDTDATIATLLRAGAKGMITDGGAGKTLTITGGDSMFSGEFAGKVTVDYTGTGKFTLGNGTKNALSAPGSSADATLKISSGKLNLYSGAATWAQKLVMGNNTTINIEDGSNVTNWGGYGTSDTADKANFKFTGNVSLGEGVSFTSTWGKNLSIDGVLTAEKGFSFDGTAYEWSYFHLNNANNTIGGKIDLNRGNTVLGIISSGSLGTASVETSLNSHYITYYGTKGVTADVINNEMTGEGNFTVASGWVHLSDKVALTGNYRVDSGAILSKAGTLAKVTLNGGTLDASNGDLTVSEISGAGILGASGGNMTITGLTTLDSKYGVVVNGTGQLLADTGKITVDGATLYWNSEENTSSVLSNVALTSGLIDLSGYSAFADALGTDALLALEIDLGVDLSGGNFLLSGMSADAYQLDSSSGTTIVKFTATGAETIAWPIEWGITESPTGGIGQTVSQDANPMYNASNLDATYGSVNVVISSGTATGIGIYGGYASDVAPGAVNSDIWLAVKGGDYKRIVGGSYANNWGGGTACNITGDIHLFVGGDAEADFIFGGNYKDGQNPTINGDIYVGVADDAVIRGSLVGGTIHTHNGSTAINGDITVVVKNVQSTTDSALADSGLQTGYIIGGSVHASNFKSSSSVNNTSVIIDTGDKTGQFVKNIVGGDYIPSGGGNWGAGWGSSYVISGNSLVDIKASNDVEFTGTIMAGSFSETSGLGNITGNSTLSIDGGTYSGALYAGSGTSIPIIGGNATLIFKSGVLKSTASLNASSGTVSGSTLLTLGGNGESITFNDTKVSGFELIEFVQGTTMSGDLNLGDTTTIAILGNAGTSITLDGELALGTAGLLKLDLTQFGNLESGDVVFSTTGLVDITGVSAELASGVNGILEIQGNDIVFSSSMLIWDGGTGAEWGADNVWNKDGVDATYTTDSVVLVTDISGVDKTTITLVDSVTPGTMTVTNSTTTVELTGAGAITDTAIAKGGNGVLILGSDTVLGSGSTLNVSAGTLAYGYDKTVDLTGITLSAGAGLGATNGATVSMALADSAPAINLWADKDSTVSVTVSGENSLVWAGSVIAGDGIVEKSGTTDLAMTGNNAGHIVVSEGRFHIGHGAATNAAYAMDWGTEGSSVTLKADTTLILGGKGGHNAVNSDLILGEKAEDKVTVRWYDATQASDDSYQYALKGDVTVNGIATLSSYDLVNKEWAKEVAILNTLLGEGTIIAGRGAGDQQYNSNGKLVIDCDASGFEGTITIDATNNYSYSLDLRQSLANATVNLNSGDSAEYRAFIRVLNNVEIGELNGSANSLVGAATGEFTLTVGGGDYAGTLKDKSYALAYGQTTSSEAGTGKLSLIKTSTADLTLGGTVDLSGSVSVNGGKLLLTGTSAATVGDLTIAKGAQMTTVGDLNLGSNLSLGVNADMASLIVGGAFEGGVYALTLEGLADLTDEGEYELITALSGLSTDKSSFNWTDAGDNDLLGFVLEQTATSLKLVATSKGETWVFQADNATWSDSDLGTEWGNTNNAASVAGKDLVFNKTAFEDASFDGTVTIEGEVTPASMTVNTPEGKAFTFVSDTTTPGSITGAAALAKKGAGSLTIDLANANWTGDIAVTAGELVGNVANSLGSGAISVDGGTLTLNNAGATAGQVDLVSGGLNLTDGAFATSLIKSWTAGTLTLGDADSSASITLGRDMLNGKTAVVNSGSTLRIETLAQMGAFAMNASGTGTIIANWTHQGNYAGQSMNLSTNFQGTLEVEDGCFRLDAITMGDNAVLKLHNLVNAEQNAANHTYVNDIVFADDDVRMETTSSAYTLTGDLSGKAFSKYSNGKLIMDGGIDLEGSLQVNAGTLEVGANATVTKLADSIELAGGTLSIAQSNMSYDGVVSGSAGKLSVADGAQLTLTAANTSTATLEVLDSGAVTLSGDSVAWAGALSGSGIVNLEAANGINIAAGNTGLTGQVNVNSGSATLAGADSLGTASVAVAGGSLDMADAAVANDVLINSGSLANAGNYTGSLVVNADAGTADAENSIDLGGATAVDSLTLAADSSITGLGGALDMSGKNVDMTLTDDNVSVGSTAGEAMVDADLTLTAADTKLDLTNQALLDILTANKQSTDGVGLVLSSGTLTVDAPGSITFAPVLTTLGYVVTGVDGGALTISGNADLAYTVTDDTTSDSDTITDYAALDPYKSVAIGDEKTLTINLDGAPDASRGEGVKIADLVGTEGTTLQVNNTAADAADNKAAVNLVQNSATSFEGDIVGDNVDFTKSGSETLTVEGTISGDGATLDVTEGSIELNGSGNDLAEISTNGGDIALGGDTTVDALSGTSGTVEVADGKTLTVEAQSSADTLENTTLSGSGALALGSDSEMVLGTGSAIDGLAVDMASGSALTLDSGSANAMSGLSGAGALDMNDATLDIATTDSKFSGEIKGAGAIDVTAGKQTLSGAGNSDVALSVQNGATLTLEGTLAATAGDPATTSYKALDVADGGTLNIGSSDVPKTQISVADDFSVGAGATVNITTSSTTVEDLGAPFVTAGGAVSIGDGATITTTNLDTLVSSDSAQLNMELFKGASVSLGDNVVLNDAILSSMFDGVQLALNDDGTAIILTGMGRTENVFADDSLTENAAAGADLLWDARYNMGNNSVLRDLYSAVLEAQNAGNKSAAAQAMAAAAGSTVTALGAAQKDQLRDQMLMVRNRTTLMGVNPAYVNEEMPYFHIWMEGTGSTAELDSEGDESGYKLSTFGGTVGVDVDLSDRLTLGAAFSASYGDIDAQAADIAEGDFDSYYASVFARYQSKKWAHTLILTGGWVDASLTRTVNYGAGSYEAEGDTTGSGFGAMYELTYDIALNEDRSSILQPLFNASIMKTTMDAYTESGSAGNAALQVEEQEWTTSSVAVGARWMGLVGSNLFGREALAEVRVNVAQDFGDNQGEANVGFIGNPGYTRSVRGAEIGKTAVQVGAGLSVPVGYQGTIFVNGNADLRDGATSFNGSVGYRYDF